ncbi:MAG TPA: lysophospholipid acyltransferase family protein [Candidatus Limnocylindria bacterium]|nr:lysophospholipid acyltransferase family protein [Candidatus Limnocylindria bacterium]
MYVPRVASGILRRLSRPSTPDGSAAPERRREVLTYWLYRAAERLINALPRRVALAAATAVGNVAYDLAGPKGRLIRENLSRPMRLPVDDPRVAAAARRAFRNYAKYLVDMMRIGEIGEEEAHRLILIENIELLRSARAEGKGVIISTVHVGGMDLIGAALKAHGETLHVVADDTTYGRLYDHLSAQRAKQHVFLIGWRNLRGLFRALRGGGNLVLFCDGGYRRGDVPVEFCGEATTFPIGPATLSAKTGAPMLPVTCRRLEDDRFHAGALPLVHCAGTDPAELYRATQTVADELGGVIAADPGQWYMFRPVWPQTDAEREHAAHALAAARRGEDWTRI